MFKCKFAKMYDNNIFIKYGLTPVAEDYFKLEDNAFCVADGVTRDTIDGKASPYPKNKEETIEWVKHYPNPSGAFEAAKIVGDNFVNYIKQYDEKQINKDLVLKIAKQTNKDLIKINSNRDIDYIKEDYYCCEAVGGIIVEDNLYCFSIGDCHITVLDKNYDTLFTTINNHKQFEDYLDNIYVKQNEFDWNNPSDRVMVRKYYRNNPNKKYNGEDVSFGALSGEETAEYYIDTYKVNLKNAKYICAYSDGCEPIFEEKEKIIEIVNKPENLVNEGKERTLVIYEKI